MLRYTLTLAHSIYKNPITISLSNINDFVHLQMTDASTEHEIDKPVNSCILNDITTGVVPSNKLYFFQHLL